MCAVIAKQKLRMRNIVSDWVISALNTTKKGRLPAHLASRLQLLAHAGQSAQRGHQRVARPHALQEAAVPGGCVVGNYFRLH